MADPEETFKVSDRRGRSSEDDSRGATGTPLPSAGPAPPEHPPAREREGERSLAGLFMMLASSAVIALGDAPDPISGERHQDLAHAVDAIEMLRLLREKTEGNRSAEESQLLDSLVYDLQLRYVSATKRSGSPPGPARS